MSDKSRRPSQAVGHSGSIGILPGGYFAPRAYVVNICPECLQQQGEVSTTHTGECPNMGKIFAYRAVEVVPVGDVAQWMDETYGTPDSDEFLEEFSVIERLRRG